MAAKIQRTKPLTITEQQRRWMLQYGTGDQALAAQELVTTSDQQRLFRRDTYLGPVDHGSVDTVSALSTLYLLPTCTRGVWPGDTCWVASQGCEYRCISGSNATAVWRAVGAGQGAAGTATWGGIVGTIEAQTDLGAALAGKAPATHGHAMSDVSGLAAALAGKQATLANAGDIAHITRSPSGDPLWDGVAWPSTSGGGAPSAAALIAAALPLAWYRADAGVEESAGDAAEDGDGIAYWRDQSGNGYDLSQPTAGSRPTWVASAQNGLPGLSMSKANSWLLAAGFPSITFANLTIVLVAKSTSTDLYQAPLVVGASGGGDDYQSADKALIWLTYTSSNRVSWQGGIGSNPMFASLAGAAPTPLGVYTIRALNGSATVGANDTTVGTTDGFTSPVASAPGLLVGSIYRSGVTGDYGLIGQLYEIAIFPTALGNVTLGAIVGALRAKWGC